MVLFSQVITGGDVEQADAQERCPDQEIGNVEHERLSFAKISRGGTASVREGSGRPRLQDAGVRSRDIYFRGGSERREI
jgi:hypothetical protein